MFRSLCIDSYFYIKIAEIHLTKRGSLIFVLVVRAAAIVATASASSHFEAFSATFTNFKA